MLDLSDLAGISMELLGSVPLRHRRFLAEQVNWTSRLLGVIGSRGVGKTTMLLQALRDEQERGEQTLYIAADHIKVEALGIYDIADTFFKSGGKVLAIDEVHKRSSWPQEVKSLHDSFPRARIWFSGSSALHLQLGKADLSRRAVYYELPTLSFREYLLLREGIELPSLTLDELVRKHVQRAFAVNKSLERKPVLGLFRDYLSHGAYPFFLEGVDEYPARLRQVVEKVLYEDIPTTTGVKLSNVPVLKKVLYEIATSPPYEVNIANMSRRFEVTRNTMYAYLHHLELAGLVARVLPKGAGSTITIKPAKLFFNNTSILRAVGQELSPQDPLGTIRETFLVNQLRAGGYFLRLAGKGDFLVQGTYTFEVGGKGKSRRQISGEPNAYLVKDDLESGFGTSIPLWIFGLLY